MCVNIKTRRYTSDTSLPGEEFWQDCRSQKTANRNPDCFSSYRRNFYLPSFGCGSLARNSPQHRWFVLRQETLAATWSAATLALRHAARCPVGLSDARPLVVRRYQRFATYHPVATLSPEPNTPHSLHLVCCHPHAATRVMPRDAQCWHVPCHASC